jgi:hypothetical protein
MTIRLKVEASFFRATATVTGPTLQTTGMTTQVEADNFEQAARKIATEGLYESEHGVYYPPSMLGPITPVEEGDPK